MRSFPILAFTVLIAIVLGIYALPHLNKNEFPDVKVMQGVVAVVYPGATAEEIEEQVAGKVEEYLFTFTDVDKNNTYSYSQNGMLYVFVTLVHSNDDPKITWSRIREGLAFYRLTNLPQGVVATAVIDDFGNASSLLLAIESAERSPRELEAVAKQLSARLRAIPEMGRISEVGAQKEEIAVHMDPMKLTQYAISPSVVSAELAAHGFRTISGKVSNNEGSALVHVTIPFGNIYDLSELVIFADPETGQTLRLRDVATIESRYEESKPHIKYSDATVKDNRCIMLSIEMRPGNNVVDFGAKVENIIKDYEAGITPDIHIHRITDQPKVVDKSVRSFLKDLLEAILIVIFVMLMLFPLRTALISSTSVPICIAATLGIMYFIGFELNTVTLAALIAVLGMIVDDSVVVIDGYTDLLRAGHSRWYSAVVSTSKLANSMLFATASIAMMFFPALVILKGNIMGDFVELFPWTILIALACSFLYAIQVIPFIASRYIKHSTMKQPGRLDRIQSQFFEWLQRGYQKLLTFCFRHKILTLATGGGLTLLGAFIFTQLNMQILPKAERDSFAVEIHMAASSSIEETDAVADSLSALLLQDPRVKSITSFVGMSSPRFHLTYAPQLASDHYAQFIVNTTGDNDTKGLIAEYAQRYENIFPQAQIRFKQMDYQYVLAPVEFYLKGDNYGDIASVRDTLLRLMKQNPKLFYVHSDYDETEEMVDVVLKTDAANRLGITQSTLSVYLNGALSGTALSTLWEGDYNIPIAIYSEGKQRIDYGSLGDLMVPCAQPGAWVPLRQVADIVPRFHHNNMPHRNGVRCVTVSADVISGAGQIREYYKIQRALDKIELPEGVTVKPGGTFAVSAKLLPRLVLAVIAAICVMFLVLIIHYGKLNISLLAISMAVLCVFGSNIGLWLFGLDFSITAVLGLISLVGIIVRNAIIMYDYVAELRNKELMSVTEAAYYAGLRRMRPIFLTSATTAIGVVPMILAGTMLWMPMGVVICFGTLFTLPLVITILPVAYCVAFENKRRQNVRPAHTWLGNKHKSGPVTLVVFLCFILLPSLHSPLSAQTLSLDSCLALAKRNNTEIRTTKLEIERARAVKQQVFTKYFPQVNLAGLGYYSANPLIHFGLEDIQSNDMRELLQDIYDLVSSETDVQKEISLMKKGVSGSVVLAQPLFAGGRIVNGNKLADLGVRAAELQGEMKVRDIVENIESTYFLVVGLQQKEATVAAALNLIDSLDRIVHAALDNGLVTRADVLQLQLKRNEMLANQQQLTSGIRLAKRLLCTQIGIEYSDTLLFVDPQLHSPYPSLHTPLPALDSSRPEVQLLQLNVEAEQLQRRLTLGEALPQLTLIGTAYYGNMIKTDPSANALALLSLSIPLTSWWETSQKLRQHDIRIAEARLQQEHLGRMMSIEEDKALSDMLDAAVLLKSDSAALEIAQENYRLATLNYEAGVITIADVLQAHALLLQAQNAITDRLTTYAVARRRLLDLKGGYE